MIIARFQLGPDADLARVMSIDLQSPTLVLVTLETPEDVLFRAPFKSIRAAFDCVAEMLPSEVEEFAVDTITTLAQEANGHPVEGERA